jgi:hypothetical protein
MPSQYLKLFKGGKYNQSTLYVRMEIHKRNLETAFATKHWLLTWAQNLPESRRRAWYSCLHFISIYCSHLRFQEETEITPEERINRASQNRPLPPTNLPPQMSTVTYSDVLHSGAHLIGTRLLPSSDDSDNHFSGTPHRCITEIMTNEAKCFQ